MAAEARDTQRDVLRSSGGRSGDAGAVHTDNKAEQADHLRELSMWKSVLMPARGASL
ncbi:MAG: hypothetical protein AB8H86_19135 [Polyangiales bacterium]